MAAVSHFSDAGFALDTSNQAVFGKSLSEIASHCTPETLDAANSVCLIKDKSGAELWVGLQRGANGAWEVQTANPAFVGEGHADVEIAGDVSDPEFKPFETSISAHFAGDQVPITFELADPREAARFSANTKLTVDIAAFSYEPSVFADEAAFSKSQAKEKVAYAANFFVPSGSFRESMGGAMPDDSKRPLAYADFAGTVLKAELRTNVYGGKYWWTPVKTYAGAVFDVVMDPTSVKEDPKPGSIVEGRFWLSARISK
jgi:hypothetical protein